MLARTHITHTNTGNESKNNPYFMVNGGKDFLFHNCNVSCKRIKLDPYLTSCKMKLREYYAKGNKPVRERQVSHDFTHMWNLKNEIN